MTEKVGVEAVWNNTNFNKGQADYMKAMLQSQSVTGAMVGTMGQMGMSTSGLSGMLSSVASSLGMTTSGMLVLGAAVGAGVAAFKAITSAVGSFVDFMVKGEESAIKVASRVEQLNLIAQTLAQNQGIAGDAVNELVASLNKQGISMMVANLTIAQFSRMHLDLAKAVELGRVAQDAATIANEGSSDALEGLLHGIQTLNIRVLRTHGILVEAEDAYKRYAEANSIVGRELNSTEKQQAMLNAVIEAGTSVAGAYQASMLTAGKQMGSLTSRVLPDLKNALGAPFQGAFFNVIKGINDMLDGLRRMAEEGGALYPLLVDLGAVFQVLTDPIRALGASFTDVTEGPIAGFANTIIDIGSKMFNWGTNMVVNLATGIIQAAQTVLVGAINFIANILSYWFAPGSPPNIAPNIDQWGVAAMEEYLMGFTEADFSILDNIQNQLKNVFASLSDMGVITKQAAAELWGNFSEQLIMAIESGSLSQILLDEIKSVGGVYGEQLAKMAQEQFAVAQALDATKKAEEELTAAKERASNAGKKVNQGLIEYNQMLRSGASKEALAAKLAEINASRQEQKSAEEGITIAEDKVKSSKDNLDALREQAALTESILQNMIELNQAQVEAAKAAQAAAEKKAPEPAAGGAGGAGVPELGLGGGITPGKFDPDKILNPMRDAVNAVAEEIKKKLSLAWATIWVKFQWMKRQIITALAESGLLEYWDKLKTRAIEAWQWIQTKVGEVFGNLPITWEGFKAQWSEFWGGLQTTASGWLESIKGVVSGFIGTITAWWTEHGENIKFVFSTVWQFILTVWNNFVTNFLPVFQILWETAKQLFANTWDAITSIATNAWDGMLAIAGNVWNAIAELFANVWEMIKQVFSNALEIIGNLFDIWAAIFKGDWETVFNEIKDNIALTWDNIKIIFSTSFDNIKTIVTTQLDNIKVIWSTTWENFKTTASTAWENIKTIISGAIDGVILVITGTIGRFKSAGANLIQGLSDGMVNAIGNAIKAATGAVQSVIDAVMKMLGIKSPSKVFAELGELTMQGMEKGINVSASLPQRAMTNAVARTVTPAMVPITTGSTNYYQPSINMTNNINNGMSVPQLEALIVRTVKRGLTA